MSEANAGKHFSDALEETNASGYIGSSNAGKEAVGTETSVAVETGVSLSGQGQST